MLVFGVFLSSTDVIAKDSKRSFIKNPKKIYTYQYESGFIDSIKAREVYKDKKSSSQYWYSTVQMESEGVTEQQTTTYYNLRYTSTTLKIPRTLKVGTKIYAYSVYENNKKIYVGKITGTRATVKTKYKTFKNCITFSHDGTKSYLANNYGIVKRVDSKGKVLEQLIKVK